MAEMEYFLDPKRWTLEEQKAIRLLLTKGILDLEEIFGDQGGCDWELRTKLGEKNKDND